jgi:hypothetical protein
VVRDTFNPEFAWQEGYAAFTVSASVKPAVARYIVTQVEHHRRRPFKEELVEFLERHGTTYEPKYLD